MSRSKDERRDLNPHNIKPNAKYGKAEVWYYRDANSVDVYVQPEVGKTIVFRIMDKKPRRARGGK